MNRIWVFYKGKSLVLVNAETGKIANELILKKYKTELLFAGCFDIEKNSIVEI